MKYCISFFVLLVSSFANDPGYEKTDNISLGKYDRINLNEKRAIELNSEVQVLKKQIQDLKARIEKLEKAKRMQ